MSIIGQLPQFKAKQGEVWRNFKTSFKLRTKTSRLDIFPVFDQQVTFLGCLEDGAARAHILCRESSQIFLTTSTLDTYISKVRNIFNPPQESELSMKAFERLRQTTNMPITTYHARKIAAFHQVVPEMGQGQFEY